MTEHILIGIVSVIVLGIGAQWLAWRIRVPSILLLLVFGFLAGPVTGLLPPEQLQGDWLFAFVYFDQSAFLFLGILILVVRPVAVFLSSLGTRLTWKEQTFIAWLAPRGIVAAAVASLFAFRLEEIYGSAVDSLVPMVFLVIVGTVAVYGLTISPLARYLGLADPNPQGMLFLGAYLWVQRIAMALQEQGFKVLLIDANTKNIEQAKENNLPAETADALSEAVIDELDLSGLGRFLALTPNDEVNALAALHFTEVFENNEVYQLAARPGSQRDRQGELPEHLRGRPLFGESTTHASLSKRFNDGGEIRTFVFTEDGSYEAMKARYDDDVVLLFIVRGTNLLVHAEENQITPQPGDTVIVMLPPFSKERDLADEAFFEDLVAHAFVVDLDEAATYSEIVRQASILFAQRLPIAADRLSKGLLESTRYGGAPISQGVALPHYRIPRIARPELVLVRCKPGICIEVQEEREALFDPSEPIYAFIFLVSPEDNPGQHLRTLAHIAGRVGEGFFIDAWRAAEDEQALKEALMNPERYLSLLLSAEDKTAVFIGQAVQDVELNAESLVALIKRNGQPIAPEGQTVLREGDQITITGNTAGIQRLRNTYQKKERKKPVTDV